MADSCAVTSTLATARILASTTLASAFPSAAMIFADSFAVKYGPNKSRKAAVLLARNCAARQKGLLIASIVG